MRRFILVLALCFVFLAFASSQEYIVVPKEGERESLGVSSLFSSSSDDVIDNLDVKRRFSSSRGFVAELSREEYERLSNSGYDVRVPKKFHAMLEKSNPQIRANHSWNYTYESMNMTGKGQTVCVIDTGVNYSHPNLGGCYGNNSVDSNCTVIGGYNYCADDNADCTGESSDPMDSEGHGTHIAGIIASNHSVYQGVAPDVKIVALKVMNSTGDGGEEDLVSAIDWCVDNRTKFNISVISLSLGDGSLNNSHCDDLASLTTGAMHAAVEENISVIVSTGNVEASDGISWPSCISGVIPVGSVREDDTIYYQRGELFQVLAPGGGRLPDDYIHSTSLLGSFEDRRGTSMSVPHVAGLAAVLNQFYYLQTGLNLTNATLKDALNHTDTWVNDIDGNLNLYPRVDFLRSLYSVDLVDPNVTLIEPLNDSVDPSANRTFVVNVTDFALKNVSVYIYNSTSLVNISEFSLGGQQEQVSFNLTNLSSGEYTWSATAFDENNRNFSAQNNSFTVSFSTSINYPLNDSYTNTNETNFSCTARTSSGTKVDNMTFYLYNSSMDLLYNETSVGLSGETNTTIFNYTLPEDGSYYYACAGVNNISESSSTLNLSITLDSVSPNLTLVEPFPSSSTASSSDEVFYFNVSDDNSEVNCSLVSSSNVLTSKDIENFSVTNNITHTFSPGEHSWKLNCSDLAGNVNSSEEKNFVLTALESDDSSTSSSTSSSSLLGSSTQEHASGTRANPYLMSELSDGVERVLLRGSEVYFLDSSSERHKLKMNSVGDGVVNMTLSSDPFTFVMAEGETKKFNLSSEKYLDTKIFVERVSLRSAVINLGSINESHPDYQPEVEEKKFHATGEEENSSDVEQEAEETDSLSLMQVLFLFLAGFSFLGLILVCLSLFYFKYRSYKVVSRRLSEENAKKKEKK